MTIHDDRNDDERTTHTVLVVGTDSFMSGWGLAAGGTSYAAWACRPDDAPIVRRWVSARGEMRRVRVVAGRWRPRGPGHAHIYVVSDGHPSLAGGAA